MGRGWGFGLGGWGKLQGTVLSSLERMSIFFTVQAADGKHADRNADTIDATITASEI